MRPPTPCRWEFPVSNDWPDDDLICVGADLSADTLLHAYENGLFPMFIDPAHKMLGWWSPQDRGVIPLESFHLSRSLRKSMRRFTLTVNADFSGVMKGCATSHLEGNWIDDEFIRSYTRLHELGHAHSVEVWDHHGALVGGLYGVRINNFFAGESMFHRVTDASKAALAHLVMLMRLDGMTLLDTQWRTDHLASLGCTVIDRPAYLRMLAVAVGLAPLDHQ